MRSLISDCVIVVLLIDSIYVSVAGTVLICQ
jgi:hypothetical protein